MGFGFVFFKYTHEEFSIWEKRKARDGLRLEFDIEKTGRGPGRRFPQTTTARMYGELSVKSDRLHLCLVLLQEMIQLCC